MSEWQHKKKACARLGKNKWKEMPICYSYLLLEYKEPYLLSLGLLFIYLFFTAAAVYKFLAFYWTGVDFC